MRGAQQGKKEEKSGEIMLTDQRAEPLPGRYMMVEVDPNGKIVGFQNAKMYDMRSTVIVEQ